jgi:sugar diacid utilization regulator
MTSHTDLAILAGRLRAAGTDIANDYVRSQASSDRLGSDRLRSKEPYDLAISVVQLSAAALEDDVRQPATARGGGALAALNGLPPGGAVESLRALERSITDRFLSTPDLAMDHARDGLRRLAQLFDELCQQELDAYQSTMDELSGWYSRVGTDLVTCLASGAPVEPHTVNAQARILSVDPHQSFRAVTLYHEPAPSPQRWSTIRRRAISALRGGGAAPRQLLVRERTGILLAVVAVDPQLPDIVKVLRTLLGDPELQQSLFVATGEPADSLAAAGRSCRQAMSALEIGIYRGQRGKVIQCTEVILEVLLAHNNWVSRRIINSRLEHLLEKPHLLETLRTYIACDMALQRTADELVIHANTVAYRLRQIAGLTGRDMRSVSDLAELHVALSALDVVEMRRDQEQGRADLRSLLLN